MSQKALQLDGIAHRLTLVEKEVSQLRQMLPPQPAADGEPWYLRHAGRFAGGPEFLEVICLGQAIRRDNRSEEP